jgi:CRP/FNR family transcriptional regulator
MNWTTSLNLTRASATALAALPHRTLPPATPLFRPGDQAQVFVIVLRGRIEVVLTGPTGREILLYRVDPGQSCIQTTLGLMGDEAYTGEAKTVTDSELVLIPKPLFLRLMDEDAAFRGFVMHSFGRRMADLTRVLEQVAFGRVEVRLAALLLDLAQDGCVAATQADLATRIGSAREVITRQLHSFASAGLTRSERGKVILCDIAALRRIAASGL